MNKTKSAFVSCIGVVLILLFGIVALGISNTEIYEHNNALIEELNKVQDELNQYKDELNKTQDELNSVNEILSSTSDDLTNIQASLNNEIAKTTTLQSELETANTIIAALKSEEYTVGMTVTNYEIELIAKTVWGEARGTNTLEQSGVVWCILNRVDAGFGSIAEVVTAPNQFHGYSPNFPVTNEIKALVEDVIARWKLEKVCSWEVGRTLPSNYLYFSADSTGLSNVFRTEWTGNYEVWDWDCWNPYE